MERGVQTAACHHVAELVDEFEHMGPTHTAAHQRQQQASMLPRAVGTSSA